MRRTLWFGTGAVLGATGVVWGRKRVEVLVDRFRPAQVAGGVGDRVRGVGAHVRRAVDGGRADARRREGELRREMRLPEGGPIPSLTAGPARQPRRVETSSS
jgi:hypothetical protein